MKPFLAYFDSDSLKARTLLAVSSFFAVLSAAHAQSASETAIASAAAEPNAATAAAALPPLPPGEEIYDIMSAKALSWPWKDMLFKLALVIIAVWAVLRFYKWLTAPVERKTKVIKQSPQRMALRAIERLKLSPVWHQNQMKEICETIAAVLKTYAHDAFELGIGAPSTTDEYLTAVKKSNLSTRLFAKSRDLLEYCDKIKFTGIDTNLKSKEELLNELSSLIKDTGWIK